MNYTHPFYHKSYEVVVGDTLFFSYITFKIDDAQYETFIFDPEEGGKMLPITSIIPDVILSENQQSALTTTKQSTEQLWNKLKYIGDKELTQKYGEYLSNDKNEKRSVLDWLKLMRKK